MNNKERGMDRAAKADAARQKALERIDANKDKGLASRQSVQIDVRPMLYGTTQPQPQYDG